MPIVIGARRCPELSIFFLPLRVVVAQRDQRGGSDGNRIRPQGQSLGDVGARSDPPRDDELDLAMHAKVLESLYRRTYARKGREADMLDEDVLGRRRSSLHSVDDNHIRA